MLNSDSLERLVPDDVDAGVTGRLTLDLHLERYRFAARHTHTGRFVDNACGVGYGTLLVVEHGPRAVTGVGVDISDDVIAYARSKYAHGRLNFVCAEAMQFTAPDGFETVISLETIEHVPDPAGFVGHVRHLLNPGGVLIASAPVTPSTDANPHHLSDFTERSFRELFRGQGLREVDSLLQIQPYSPRATLARTERRTKNLRRNLLGYYVRHPRSLGRRLWTTLRHGFSNRYLTLALADDRASHAVPPPVQ